MSDEQKPEFASAPQTGSAQNRIDRRRFFTGAAALTVGSLGARGALAQVTSPPPTAAPATPSASALEQLEAQTRRALRWAGRDPADWVRPRAGVDHNLVIVGAGQSGVSLAYGFKRKGVGRVDLIDQADPGQAGIWRNIARMRQLRTPKTLPGPEQGNVAIGFRAWFETLHGPEAFDALDRIPRLAWADYLTWFQQITDTKVRYRTRLLEIEPQGDLLRLHLETDGARRVETTRKLVLANGYAGAGGPNVPGFIRALPANVWTHTTGRLPVETWKGKVIGVVGAGSNAFDAAAVALEAGAADVHLFSRRAYIDYQTSAPAGPPPQAAPPPDRGYPNMLELTYELPDVVRWRNFLAGERRVASVPLDSLERAVAFRNFHIHLNTSLSDVAMAGNRISAKAGRKTLHFDYLIAATGYRVDLARQPELARIHEQIARWGDRFKPAPGEENEAGAAHPYLGAGFQFLPRGDTGAEYLRNIHCYNLGAALSFGIPVGDVPSQVDEPRLVNAVARDLYVEGVDIEAHKRFTNAPQVAPSAAPYERAVVGGMKNAAA
ncbi:MAG TPA: SidA/IucD/PvdA family monooxygenase [Gammaproteobacteria bacterium]|jgi:cation diffusion facilitator CzcD-associated flavoprotein CzcO|nr:SidA/IucD/PvdA family monooxygenase [Gammaproteobacteria bacterium]